MKMRNRTKFHIQSLNQEKLLSKLCKLVPLEEIERKNKLESSFECSYFDSKRVEKFLKNNNVKILDVKHFGLAFQCKRVLSAYGLLLAVVVFLVFYLVQNQFVLQYQVNGTEKLDKFEVVEFVKDNFSSRKSDIATDEVEVKLMEKFDEISFVSCIIKGQTLVLNIKEKLLPDEMYGTFSPIVAQKDGKITKIDLISGTANVEVGDIVQKGDILVSPYMIDTSGNVKHVETRAEILAQVFNEGSCDHYESFIQVERTGKKVEESEVTLFGLSIYKFKQDVNFSLYEVEYENIDLTNNLFLPFKLKKTIYYELEEKVVESKFEDVQDEYIAKAREKALENCENCDTIIEEFYTLRHLSGITIVNYCIVTQEQIGGTYDS